MRLIAWQNYDEGAYIPAALLSFGQVECTNGESHGYLAVKLPLPFAASFEYWGTVSFSDHSLEPLVIHDRAYAGFIMYLFRKGTFGFTKTKLCGRWLWAPMKYF